MDIRHTTRKIIAEVEARTGRPVQVVTDPSLKVLATVRMARSGFPAHFVAYKPNAKLEPDYLICWHCGFILRLFEHRPEERFDFQPLDGGLRTVERAVGGHGGLPPNLPKEVRDGFVRQLFEGLMLQLRSYPVGLRVDAWLASTYPDLLPLQREWVLRQLQDNQQTLKADVTKLVPQSVQAPALAMNAAFATYWARTWGEPPLALPWSATANSGEGRALLEILDKGDPGPRADRALIDAWALRLGLADWYRWVPYSND